ncbi:MAG: acetyl esterase [Frankiales bacterium]|nr:acetyl esterase [Frankiales bacterium]
MARGVKMWRDPSKLAGMTLDPQIAAILPLLADAPPLSDPITARAGFRLFTVDLRDPATLAAVRSTEDTPQGARIYRPDVDGPTPTVLFIHGGGYVIGDIETHDDQARLICNRVGATVVSIDYRLAPEHPFPAGWEDCVAAFEHVIEDIDSLGGDPTRIGVAGDSAGGNLSAGVAQYARDKGLPLKAQCLLYPGIDFTLDETAYPSRVDNAEGYFLTAADMLWFRDQYQPTEDPRASVIRGELEGLAPAVVATAEYDPLRDEGEAYAALLEKAGVTVRAKTYPGLIHGFFGLGHLSQGAALAIDEICQDFKELLG